jgi:hypothetical protein
MHAAALYMGEKLDVPSPGASRGAVSNIPEHSYGWAAHNSWFYWLAAKFNVSANFETEGQLSVPPVQPNK